MFYLTCTVISLLLMVFLISTILSDIQTYSNQHLTFADIVLSMLGIWLSFIPGINFVMACVGSLFGFFGLIYLLSKIRI